MICCLFTLVISCSIRPAEAQSSVHSMDLPESNFNPQGRIMEAIEENNIHRCSGLYLDSFIRQFSGYIFTLKVNLSISA